MAVASCVPPQSLGNAPKTAAAQPQPAAPSAPRFGIAPGTILAQMPAMPVAPPPVAGAPEILQAAPAFSATAQSADDAGRALDCLTAAVYYEARSESPDGQRAVAQVVLNRVRNPAFPGSVCGVVYQGSYRATGCQFSFTCDGSLLQRREPGAWIVARRIAQDALAGEVYAPVGAAMYYHTTAVHPWWAPSLTPVTTIGAHIFYRWGNSLDNSFEFRQNYAGIEPNGAGAAGWDQAQQVLVRYGTSESAGVMVHRGSGEQQVATASDGDGDQPGGAPSVPDTAAASVTSHGVTIRTGSAAFPGIRIHRGTGAPVADAPAATVATETASAEAPAAADITSSPGSSAARD
ncbi:cell wall hydrolase [Sphingomonas abietis]|uniref:Cell wall hydrolase n=1 Tax=Sphingomonas abietis TaxID=3012344 RepID=A0ABY7NMF8_9SPHN|nr:cell wall hydrolase [Sphingomonas abietis]WBO21676.1 cell wall hydrolase [Sphingomonas abietis]